MSFYVMIAAAGKRSLQMRLRNIKGSREIIAASPFVVHQETNEKGNWNRLFEQKGPLYIEIGMGKGQFLTELAAGNPEKNFVGIEKYSSVLLRAIEKQQELQLSNVKLIRMDAEYITDVFAPGEVAGIYLNFSDPWPKDRHEKRRLTSKQFLRRYEQILSPGGTVQFKTDNQALFDFSLEEASQAGWELLCVTRDLHQDPVLCRGNIMTEYEERFSSMGNPICMLRMRPADK